MIDSKRINIILVGYRGVGKSTVAKLLSKLVKKGTIDTDEWLEHWYQQPLKELFKNKGFREIEYGQIKDLCAYENAVIALGGGALDYLPTFEFIKSLNAHIIWLKSSKEIIIDRLKNDTKERPKLTKFDTIEEETEVMLKRREKQYLKCCHIIVNTDKKTPEEVAQEIYEVINYE